MKNLDETSRSEPISNPILYPTIIDTAKPAMAQKENLNTKYLHKN